MIRSGCGADDDQQSCLRQEPEWEVRTRTPVMQHVMIMMLMHMMHMIMIISQAFKEPDSSSKKSNLQLRHSIPEQWVPSETNNFICKWAPGSISEQTLECTREMICMQRLAFFFFLFFPKKINYFAFLLKNKHAMMHMMQTRLASCASLNTGSKLRLELWSQSSETQSQLVNCRLNPIWGTESPTEQP